MVARFSSEGAENLIGSLKGRLDSLKSRFDQGRKPAPAPRSARSRSRFLGLDDAQDTHTSQALSADFDDEYACDESTAREFAEYGPSYNEETLPASDVYSASAECAPLVSQSDIRARKQQSTEPSFNSATGRMLIDQLTPAYESPREKAARMAQGREQSRSVAFSEQLTPRGRMSVPHVNNPQRAAYDSVASRKPNEEQYSDYALQNEQASARSNANTGSGSSSVAGAQGNAVRTDAAASERASAREQRASGLHSLFAQGSAQAIHTSVTKSLDASTASSQAARMHAPAQQSSAASGSSFASSYNHAANSAHTNSAQPSSTHAPLNASAFKASSAARSICMLTAHNYNDAEHIVDALKRGDITVLALNLVNDALSKRILDFCFGVCAVLGGHVDLIKPGVYLFYTGSALSQSEFSALRERGVLM